MINRFTLVIGATFASFALLTGSAHAFEQVDPGQALISGFASKHLNTNKFRENNYGIGYRTETGYLAGYYRNSEDRDGFYAGREFHFQVASHVRLGVMAGVVTGYKKRDVMPLLLPEVLLTVSRYELALTMVPKLDKLPSTLAAQLRFKF